MNHTNTIKKVAIVGYNRIPFARANTAYAEVGNQQMMTAALDGLVTKYNLKGKLIGEVAGGAVIKHTYDNNLMRECVLKTTLDPATPACDLQQACDRVKGVDPHEFGVECNVGQLLPLGAKPGEAIVVANPVNIDGHTALP